MPKITPGAQGTRSVRVTDQTPAAAIKSAAFLAAVKALAPDQRTAWIAAKLAEAEEYAAALEEAGFVRDPVTGQWRMAPR